MLGPPTGPDERLCTDVHSSPFRSVALESRIFFRRSHVVDSNQRYLRPRGSGRSDQFRSSSQLEHLPDPKGKGKATKTNTRNQTAKKKNPPPSTDRSAHDHNVLRVDSNVLNQEIVHCFTVLIESLLARLLAFVVAIPRVFHYQHINPYIVTNVRTKLSRGYQIFGVSMKKYDET